MRRLLTRRWLPLVLLVGAAIPATAQDHWDMKTGAEIRGRFEARDNRDFSDTASDRREDQFYRIRLNFRFDNKPYGLTLFYQAQDAIDRLVTPGNGDLLNDVGTHQAYLEWRPTQRKDWAFRAGRQELIFGNERLIGAANWENIGRSFDGLRATWSRSKTEVSLFAVQLGQAPLRPSAPKLYGVYSTLKPGANRSLDLYALYKRDRVTGVRQEVTTVGARGDRRFGRGLDAQAEGALQFGKIGSKDLEAWAFSGGVGYTLAAGWKPRIGLDYSAASGGDPADPSKAHTFDQLFPTNHAKYGLADYLGWRNMQDIRLGVSARPRTGVTVNADYHWFALQDARDSWYGANGRPNVGVGGKVLRDPTGAAGHDLGDEIDLYATYSPSTQWSFGAGYARFVPGSFVRQVNGSADASDWWYVQALWRH